MGAFEKRQLHNSVSVWIMASAAATVFSGAAQATPVTMSQTISLGNLLSAPGAQVAGQFDISSLLPPSTYQTPYEILAATVTAYGYAPDHSNTSQSQSGYQYAGGYSGYYTYYVPHVSYGSSCSFWGGCYYYAYTDSWQPGGTGYYSSQSFLNTITNTVTDGVDGMQLTAGVDQGTAQTTPVTSSNNNGWQYYYNNYYNYGYSAWDPGSYYGYSYVQTGYVNDYYYNTTITNSSLAMGPLSILTALSAVSLSDLAQDGLLAFTIANQSGYFIADSITLSFDIEQNPPVDGVPAPGALLLLGGGLSLLGLGRVFSQKKTADQA